MQKKNKILVNHFNLKLGEEIIEKIRKAFSIEESINMNEIPMMWLIGDLESHIDENVDDDLNKDNFDNTYVIYLSDNEGRLVIKDEEYLIKKGIGYMFSKEIHGSKKTSMTPRLCIGSFGIDNKSNKICRAGLKKGKKIKMRQAFTLQNNESNTRLTEIIITIAILSIIFYYFWYSRKKR